MSGLRRAFAWASIGRYAVMGINLATTIAVARIVPPAAFGVSVIGGSIYAIAEALRELGGGAYLIQQNELTIEKKRTSFTISLLVSLAIAACLYISAVPLARFYELAEMKQYIYVTAAGYALGPFVFPIFALMSREMAFGSFALVSVSMSFFGALTTIVFALLGYSYMSFAWATVASAFVGSVLCYLLGPDRSIYRLSLIEWRSVMGFGIFDSATALVGGMGDYAPFLILGKVLDPANVGIAQRAILLSLFPGRVILAGVGAVALPVFSRSVRQGSGTKATYLRAIELITGIQWPCLILFGFLANPMISILLGQQWHEAAPLLRILCVGVGFSFPWALQYPVLVAVGKINLLPRLVGFQAVLNTGAVFLTAKYGLLTVVTGWAIISPINTFAAVWLVRRYLQFRWLDFILALRKSAWLSVMSCLGPICVAVAVGGLNNLTAKTALIALPLSAAGWVAGLLFGRHPLRGEVVRGLTFSWKALRTRGFF